MSASSRTYSDGDATKVELPVFLTPVDLLFSVSQRKSLLTIFNPYDNDAQFSIKTTSPTRYDVSLSKGIIKPQRRIDITIRLTSLALEDLPPPSEEPSVVDYFRVALQVGQVKGIKPVKVRWCDDVDRAEIDEFKPKLKSKVSKLSLSQQITNQTTSQTRIQNSRILPSRLPRNNMVDTNQGNSNANLICTICALVCVTILFLPLSPDSEQCKKISKTDSQNSKSLTSNFLSLLTNLLSVSFEMKLGCSFALGLFTYRLISTLPN